MKMSPFESSRKSEIETCVIGATSKLERPKNSQSDPEERASGDLEALNSVQADGIRNRRNDLKRQFQFDASLTNSNQFQVIPAKKINPLGQTIQVRL